MDWRLATAGLTLLALALGECCGDLGELELGAAVLLLLLAHCGASSLWIGEGGRILRCIRVTLRENCRRVI